jgi:high-affinity nickel-transport protein
MIHAGIFSSIFLAFALGLRHGADPDHIAAIDNLTRNSFSHRPWLSRYCGTMFAGGHSIMVLSIAAIVGILGSHLGPYGATIENIGTWISIVVLVLIAILNVMQLRGNPDRIVGVKTRLLPKILREATSPWVAVPVGLLFGFGFETSSQIVAYSLVLGIGSGLIGGLIIGAIFCLGMVCTDTLDSVIVHRLVSDRASLRPGTIRIWIGSVTIVALFVAGYECAQVLGWLPQSPQLDLDVTFGIVGVLLAVFAYVFARTRRASDVAQPVTLPGAPL